MSEARARPVSTRGRNSSTEDFHQSYGGTCVNFAAAQQPSGTWLCWPGTDVNQRWRAPHIRVALTRKLVAEVGLKSRDVDAESPAEDQWSGNAELGQGLCCAPATGLEPAGLHRPGHRHRRRRVPPRCTTRNRPRLTHRPCYSRCRRTKEAPEGIRCPGLPWLPADYGNSAAGPQGGRRDPLVSLAHHRWPAAPGRNSDETSLSCGQSRGTVHSLGNFRSLDRGRARIQ